tara:strand:- start:221 stop:640 length:420 start_codon:yes stop_codon:yes gene_type:complete
MSLNTNPERFYYVSNNRLALVEKNGTVTTDNASTQYKTITEAKPLRLHTISRADHFTTGSTTDASEYSSSTLGPLGHIPVQFHEALVYKIIAMGYKTPPQMNIQLAQYFDLEYDKIIREAKKYSRANFTQTGMINPVSF